VAGFNFSSTSLCNASTFRKLHKDVYLFRCFVVSLFSTPDFRQTTQTTVVETLSFLPQKYHVNILGQILMTLLRHLPFPSGFLEIFHTNHNFLMMILSQSHRPFHLPTPTGPKYLGLKIRKIQQKISNIWTQKNFRKTQQNDAPFLPQKLLLDYWKTSCIKY
jgi:hypothetical protein